MDTEQIISQSLWCSNWYLLLTLAREHGVSHLQIFRDSLLVIKCMRQEFALRNYTLQPLLLDVWYPDAAFSHIKFANIFMNRKAVADGLSKGMDLD